MARAADLINRTLGDVGKHFSESPRSAAEIEAYARDMADMFCAGSEKKAPICSKMGWKSLKAVNKLIIHILINPHRE